MVKAGSLQSSTRTHLIENLGLSIVLFIISFMIPACSVLRGTTAETQPAVTQLEGVPEGKVTTPQENTAGKANLPQSGEASWYGGKLDGKKTASGNTFDQNEYTAAHRTLPFGTKVKVINLENGKSVDVEITDRGPFAQNRIIDLSHAAAKALDMKENGTAKVRLEALAQQ